MRGICRKKGDVTRIIRNRKYDKKVKYQSPENAVNSFMEDKSNGNIKKEN